MTDHSNSAVGRAVIDAYLDSVDEALIAAHAPRSDRMQVLQDLESQIADMLAQQPEPLTEEAVQAVIKTLEPPSHFAATYGNGKRSAPPSPGVHVRLPEFRFSQIRWSLAAAISAALLPAGCLLMWLAMITAARGPAVGFTLMLMFFVGFAFTPFALWKARKQLLAELENPRDRGLFVKSIITYGTFAPALLAIIAAVVTDGTVLIPFGVVAFAYIQYVVIRRLYRDLTDGVPYTAPSASPVVPNGNGIGPALTPAGP